MIVRNATFGKTACIALGAAALLIAGCAKSEGAPQAAGVVARTQPPDASVVRSSSVGKARAPIRVEFDRRQGLEPGQAEQIEVTLLPQATLDSLQVDFKGSDGLMVQSGAHYSHQGVAAAAVPVLHRISVSAATAGRYRVSVVVSTSVGGAPTARALAIPVVIGDIETAARVQVQSTAQSDSTGQRIKVLPGVRRTR